MCGIAGLWERRSTSADELTERARRMAATLHHRGPDDAGEWYDAAAGVAFGFSRLAVLDLTPTGRQPMASASGRYVIVFNGEIYNHRELRRELEAQGHQFRGTSDTEVILASCEAWGVEAAVQRLWGMFAVALWDARERRLVLVRDRIGKKPLYYGSANGAFVFASELKALCAYPGFGRDVDRDALAGYFRFGYVPAPASIFSGVAKLPPGCVGVVDEGGGVEVRRFWDARSVVDRAVAERRAIDTPDAVEQLDALLRDAVARRMIADVPLGALLSGGIDSSSVVALMQAQSSRPIRTFTIGFPEGPYDEAEAARAVAARLGTDHTELVVTPEEARAVVPRLPDLYDEPFADASQIPTFLVCAMARREVTVALSGDGGDEVFCGYTRYLVGEALWRRLRRVPRPARRAAAAVLGGVSTAVWDQAYRLAEPFLPAGVRQRHAGEKLRKVASVVAVRSDAALYRRLVSLWPDPHEVVPGASEPATALDDAEASPALSALTERMMFLDLVTYLPDDILAKVDRASMGVGLEARAPLLDHRVVEWAWRLPLGLKKRDGAGKWILRQVLSRYVPEALVARPKMGFGAPLGAWLRGPLREWAEALLAGERLRREGFLAPEVIRRAWRAHLAGRGSYGQRLWAVLMFQAWKERWAP
jgi:asparagine synthase (glutamine-hydrolysing)